MPRISSMYPKYQAEASSVGGGSNINAFTNVPVTNDTSPHRRTMNAPLPK